MSSGKEASTSSDGDSPGESSANESVTPPRRYEPITGEDDQEEDDNMPGTIRRNRPTQISTNSGVPNYGTSFGSMKASMDVAETLRL